MNVARYVDSLEEFRSTTIDDLHTPVDTDETTSDSQSAVPKGDDADEDIFESVESISYIGLVEMVLKNRPRLHRIIRDPSLQPELIPRLLAISLSAFVFFGAAMTVVLLAAGTWPQLTSIADVLNAPQTRLIAFSPIEEFSLQTSGGLLIAALKLTAAYALGLIAATGICLPSLYFYGLLSGVKMTMLDVVVHALKSKATAAVALVGILPIYAALCMGMVIFGAPAFLLHATLWLGLMLPFIGAFWGTYSLYTGFEGICHTMPPGRRERRECFLRRLVLSWSAVYTAVGPVMIFSLWVWLQTLGNVG
jgi:hypothetical protein